MNRNSSSQSCNARLAAAVVLSLLLACDGSTGSRGKQGPAGPPGPPAPTDKELAPTANAPGVNVAILAVSGGSGPNGEFQPGDSLSVTFTLSKDDGTPWGLSELDRLRALVSGPTFNYQRVFAEQSDPLTASLANPDGSYTYTFPDPLPAGYLAPLNDTASFDADDGELTGQALLSGTYTLGLYGFWEYEVEGETFRDVGDATWDFLVGTAAGVQPRAVTSVTNCNQCHETLMAHGGARRNLGICLLCHTSGAEDRNTPTVANGTPGISIDFKIMIHRIHNGAHLPSVLGVASNLDGSRDYTAKPTPYEVMGFGNSLNDFSRVYFPAWPSLTIPTLRDAGYTALSATDKATEDEIRRGVVSCENCHGDPDGGGPLEAPTGGALAYQQPTRNACGSCHDDVDWESSYVANDQTMPAQANDSQCIVCHPVMGTGLAVEDAHRHPLLDTELNPGLVFGITSVDEAGAHDADGTLDTGEKVSLTFTLQDLLGNEVAPATLTALNAALSGPTDNLNLLMQGAIPPAAVQTKAEGGSANHVVLLPQTRLLEFVGLSTGVLGEVFATSGAPHWQAVGAPTSVSVVTGVGDGLDTLAAAGSSPQNYVDLADATGFARNEYVVIDEGLSSEEYLRIQFVDGNRLWFSSPASSGYPLGLRSDHPLGVPVEEVVLATVPTGNYALDVDAGTITETTEFGAGRAVLVSYTTDFVLPERYSVPLNGSPDLDETFGEWQGKTLVDGTYLVQLWGDRAVSVTKFGETNSYRGVSMDPSATVLVGSATTLEPYDLISSAENCYACHDELRFHGGGRAGFDTCILCHGTAGAEDRPQYVAANAPPTTGVDIGFRQMLHKIHMGAELANASTYTVVGFGLGYPNNYSEHTYGEVEFPAFPDGVQDCAKCHGGANEAWMDPADRNHPTEEKAPMRRWRGTCSSCHDADDALAHMEVQTSAAGVESCAVCHGEGKEQSVELVHKVR